MEYYESIIKSLPKVGSFIRAAKFGSKQDASKIFCFFQIFEKEDCSGRNIFIKAELELDGRLKAYNLLCKNIEVDELFKIIILKADFAYEGETLTSIPPNLLYDYFLLDVLKLPINLFCGRIMLDENMNIERLRNSVIDFNEEKDYVMFLAGIRGHDFTLIIPKDKTKKVLLLDSGQLVEFLLVEMKKYLKDKYDELHNKSANEILIYLEQYNPNLAGPIMLDYLLGEDNKKDLIYHNVSIQDKASCSLFACIFTQNIIRCCKTYDDISKYIESYNFEYDTQLRLAEYRRPELFRTTDKSIRMRMETNSEGLVIKKSRSGMLTLPIYLRRRDFPALCNSTRCGR
ncbi:MAG: hypothetical protein PHY80_04800 [Rickettsiales bacterium]|nr:hypothetical protein [Rickettsiales bacterium]